VLHGVSKYEECTKRVGEIGNAYKVLIEYLDGRAFGRPRWGLFGWECETTVDCGLCSSSLGQWGRSGAVANTVVKGRLP